MPRSSLIAAAFALTLAACDKQQLITTPANDAPSATRTASPQRESRGRGLTCRPHAICAALDGGGALDTGLILQHGGSAVSYASVPVYLIFWGPNWGTNPTFTRDKISSMQSFFQGVGWSEWTNSLAEYGASRNILYWSTQIDHNTQPNDLSTTITTEVCGQGIADSTGVYMVYSELPATPNALGFHFSSTCSYPPLGLTIPVNIAFIYNLDSAPAWLPNGDGIHSFQTAQIANTSAHEFAEMLTDPFFNGWYANDFQGENADKCNGVFPATHEVFQNSTQWLVQTLWSNNAYRMGTGLPGYYNVYISPPEGPERGCVAG